MEGKGNSRSDHVGREKEPGASLSIRIIRWSLRVSTYAAALLPELGLEGFPYPPPGPSVLQGVPAAVGTMVKSMDS